MSNELSIELWRRALVFTDETPSVLLVDSEPTVLRTLSHQLGGDYRIVTAADGPAALEALDRHGPFATVVSDMRMPKMNGIELLEQVRLRYPQTSRVLHTAQADLTSAISAINDGQVFRFLCKPCPVSQLRNTVRDAVEHHRLVAAEQEILGKTLRGSLQAIFGCLELASPQAFARAERVRDLVGELCRELGLSNAWELETAAMASQLGAIALPHSVLQKLNGGLPLSGEEQKLVDTMPGVAARLLGDVPMLEGVIEIVRGLQPADGDGLRAPARPAGPMVPAAVGVLRAAIGFEGFSSRGVTAERAIAVLEGQGGYDADVLTALRRIRGIAVTRQPVRAFRVSELEVGMRIAEDIVAVNGLVLIGSGVLVTEMLLERLTHFKHTVQIAEPVWATAPSTSSAASAAAAA
ncbi:response regulator [Planomonospora sp. ID67723]|uniref:response regulator n=1 Tax=Planomonospora sp. ID67723 TaxID=2738134 RepID=UPI0018C3A22F|nr:HD domain-containing phosphohydrolase [Planomonospora sp. ID67723]MBG0830269.1 response regulator [Planomonospora sp. ID67723]